jgi:phosphatidylinositol alpha-1,6-mannosyltransferase
MVTFDPPTGSGGIEGRTTAYTSGLLRSGIHVEVAAFSPGRGRSEEPYLGTRLVRLSSSIARLPWTLTTLLGMIRSSSLDSVFFLSGGSTPIGILTLSFSRLTGRRCGVFFYGKDILQARRTSGGTIIMALSVMLAGRVATNSRYTAGLLPVRPRRHLVIIYPGVDPNIAHEVSGGTLDKDHPRILFVGRLIRRKGADVLLTAFSQLGPGPPESRLDIVGDGPEMKNLRAQADTLRLGGAVTFYGPLYGPELWKRYAEASVFAMPSRQSNEDVEGYGTVFLEAGIFGVPSVGTRTGGIPEAVIDGVTGKLVNSEDVRGLRDAIQGLLDDPDESRRLGRNAKARAAQHTWEASTRQVLQLLGESEA